MQALCSVSNGWWLFITQRGREPMSRKRCTQTGNLFAPPQPQQQHTRAEARAASEDPATAEGRRVSGRLSDTVRRRRIGMNPRKQPESFILRLQGPIVIERFRIERASVEAKPGKRPYARFTVGDRSGTITLFHWCPEGREQAEALVRDFPPRTVVIVDGTVARDERGARIIVNPDAGGNLTRCTADNYDPRDYDRNEAPLYPPR